MFISIYGHCYRVPLHYTLALGSRDSTVEQPQSLAPVLSLAKAWPRLGSQLFYPPRSIIYHRSCMRRTLRDARFFGRGNVRARPCSCARETSWCRAYGYGKLGTGSSDPVYSSSLLLLVDLAHLCRLLHTPPGQEERQECVRAP